MKSHATLFGLLICCVAVCFGQCSSFGCLASGPGGDVWQSCTSVSPATCASDICQINSCTCSPCGSGYPCGCSATQVACSGGGCTCTAGSYSCCGFAEHCATLANCMLKNPLCNHCLACNCNLELEASTMTPITGILKKPQTVEQSKGSSGIKYTFVARDGVFEREEESKNPAQPTLRWRMYTYSDGKFALLHFLGESETPSTILVWDGVNRIMVVPKARTTNTYPEPPHWGARQIGALISLDGVTERTDVQVDRAPLLIPPDYTERTPSETYLAYMRVTGQSPDERFLSNAKLRDASYKTGQEELAARNQSCTLPALQPVPKLPIQTP